MVDIFAFEEWRQEQERLNKAPVSGGIQAPISPLMAGGQNGIPGKTYSPTGPTAYQENAPVPPNPWVEDIDSGMDFYSPMQPLWPFGPPNITYPRSWDYPIGYNLNYIPARLELMQMLRGMRASWGVLSTIISTRQDQLMRIPWTIQRRDKPHLKSVGVEITKKFFKCPDGQNRYRQWANLLTDDLLVLDAPAIYFFRDRAGRPLAAQVMDGATIFPLIDDAGRRPESKMVLTDDGYYYLKRQPAFQQIIKGMPLVDLDESELIYAPMRARPHLPMFGYPGTEQILIEASEAIRKTWYQLNFWAEGTIPDLIVTVPETWTPRQIAMFQGHFDAFMSGNTSLKSKVRFLPGGMKPFDVKNASGESLWSQRDETLIRLACYAYSVSPTPFVKQVNRSVAQNAQSSAEQEGLYPLMGYWKECVMDPIIQEKFGFEDVEFIFLPRPEQDGEKQAKILDMYVKRGIFSRNRALEELGQEPIPGGDAHTIELGNAIVPVEDAANGMALPMGNPEGNSVSSRTSSNNSRKPASGNSRGSEATPQKGPTRPVHEAPTAASKLAKLILSELDELAGRADGDVNSHSHARLAAGNYRKGHIRLGGLDISIENSRGSIRGKKRRDGTLKWANEMPAHYGYIRGTIGADGDQLDVFVGKNPENLSQVWIIDQTRISKKGKIKFDEHKIMLGYDSLKKALRDYKDAYGARMQIASIVEASFGEFKTWIKSGQTKKPSAGNLGEVIYETKSLRKLI